MLGELGIYNVGLMLLIALFRLIFVDLALILISAIRVGQSEREGGKIKCVLRLSLRKWCGILPFSLCSNLLVTGRCNPAGQGCLGSSFSSFGDSSPPSLSPSCLTLPSPGIRRPWLWQAEGTGGRAVGLKKGRSVAYWVYSFLLSTW